MELNLVVGISNFPRGIAASADTLYWASQNNNTIGIANLDGSNAVLEPSIGSGPQSVAVNAHNLYWSCSGSNEIIRAELDGTSATVLIATPVNTIAIDDQYIYWTTTNQSIGRAELDGSNPDPNFIAAGGDAYGLAVDDNYIYWGVDSPLKIGRANLDGTGIDTSFISTTDPAFAIAVDSGHIIGQILILVRLAVPILTAPA